MSWLASASPPWPGSITASSPAPPRPGPTPSACRSCARRRCSTRSRKSQRSGSRASPRRSPAAGGSTPTSCSARATAGSRWRPSRVSTGRPVPAFCGSISPRAAARVIELDLRAISPRRRGRRTRPQSRDGPAGAGRIPGAGRGDREVRPPGPAPRPDHDRRSGRAARVRRVGGRCSATTAPRSRSCATCPSASAPSARGWRRRCASGWRRRPPSSPSRATTRSSSSPRRSVRVAQDRARHGRILAAGCGRGQPRADQVLPRARHQRLAVGLAAGPGRGPGSGRARSLPGPARGLRPAVLAVAGAPPTIRQPVMQAAPRPRADPSREASPRPAGTRATARRARRRQMTRAARPAADDDRPGARSATRRRAG